MEEGGRDRWLRRVTRNKGWTESKAEGGRKEQTIETQLWRQRDVDEDKAKVFFDRFSASVGYFLPLCHRQ